jgi:hypothetical protein
MSLLLAGPWIGEFGWEIMKWVPFVRKFAKDNKFDKVYIMTRETSFPLYRDFADEFIKHETYGDTKLFVCNNQSPKVPKDLIEILKPSHCLIPSHGSMLAPENMYSYVRYGFKRAEMRKDILVHARATGKTRSHHKNWSRENWESLVEMCEKANRKISFIGDSKASYFVKRCEDLRDISLNNLMDTMKSSNLCIGPSSGPMHLASLCECPHIVWGDNREWNSGNVKSNLKDRYYNLWNPFNTFCRYISERNWNPEPSEIFGVILASNILLR